MAPSPLREVGKLKKVKADIRATKVGPGSPPDVPERKNLYDIRFGPVVEMIVNPRKMADRFSSHHFLAARM